MEGLEPLTQPEHQGKHRLLPMEQPCFLMLLAVLAEPGELVFRAGDATNTGNIVSGASTSNFYGGNGGTAGA